MPWPILANIGMNLSSLIEATLAHNGVGKLTGKTGPHARRYSGLHVPDPRGRYLFREMKNERFVQATAALQSYCQQELSSIHSKVQVAQPLETLDMSLQTPTYQALLARELVSSVRLRAMGDYKLGWLKGVARPPSQQVNAPPKTDMVLTRACAGLALQENAHQTRIYTCILAMAMHCCCAELTVHTKLPCCKSTIACVMLHCFSKPAMPKLPSSLNMRV